jgi:hypothetical protein
MSTYYFDWTGGNDANDGLSVGAAKKTITALNALVLNPGDTILLKRGETWSGIAILVSYSGNAGNLITYDAYGAGALPIIIGDADHCFNNDQNIAKNFLHVCNIEFDGNGTTYEPVSFAGHDNLIEDCLIHDGTGEAGIWVRGDASDVYNTIVSNCTVYDNLHSGICANSGHMRDDSVYNVTIQDCTCYGNGSSEAADHGIYVGDGYSITVQRNTCYNNYAGGIKTNDNETVPVSTGGHIIDRNLCYNNKNGIYIGSYDNLVTNNLLYTNTQGGIFFLSADPGHQIYHNTICNNSTAGLYFYGSADECTDLKVKNNLMITDQAVVPWMTSISLGTGDAATLTDGAGNDFDNNAYYALNHNDGNHIARDGDGTHFTLAQWQALAGSQDGSSTYANPVVVTQWTDLHLQAGSPCIALGDPAVGVLTDYDGLVRGAAVDAGAYEYEAGGPPPAGYSVFISSVLAEADLTDVSSVKISSVLAEAELREASEIKISNVLIETEHLLLTPGVNISSIITEVDVSDLSEIKVSSVLAEVDTAADSEINISEVFAEVDINSERNDVKASSALIEYEVEHPVTMREFYAPPPWDFDSSYEGTLAEEWEKWNDVRFPPSWWDHYNNVCWEYDPSEGILNTFIETKPGCPDGTQAIHFTSVYSSDAYGGVQMGGMIFSDGYRYDRHRISFYILIDGTQPNNFPLFSESWSGIDLYFQKYLDPDDTFYIEIDGVIWSAPRTGDWIKFEFYFDTILATYSVYVDDVTIKENEPVPWGYDDSEGPHFYIGGKFWNDYYLDPDNPDSYLNNFWLDDLHVNTYWDTPTVWNADFETDAYRVQTDAWWDPEYYWVAPHEFTEGTNTYLTFDYNASSMSKAFQIKDNFRISFQLRMPQPEPGEGNKDVFTLALAASVWDWGVGNKYRTSAGPTDPMFYFYMLMCKITYDASTDKFIVDNTPYSDAEWDMWLLYEPVDISWDRHDTWKRLEIYFDYHTRMITITVDGIEQGSYNLPWWPELCWWEGWLECMWGWCFHALEDSAYFDIDDVLANTEIEEEGITLGDVTLPYPKYASPKRSRKQRTLDRAVGAGSLVYDTRKWGEEYTYTWSPVTESQRDDLLTAYLAANTTLVNFTPIEGGDYEVLTDNWKCKYLSRSDTTFLYEVSFSIIGDL